MLGKISVTTTLARVRIAGAKMGSRTFPVTSRDSSFAAILRVELQRPDFPIVSPYGTFRETAILFVPNVIRSGLRFIARESPRQQNVLQTSTWRSFKYFVGSHLLRTGCT